MEAIGDSHGGSYVWKLKVTTMVAAMSVSFRWQPYGGSHTLCINWAGQPYGGMAAKHLTVDKQDR